MSLSSLMQVFWTGLVLLLVEGTENSSRVNKEVIESASAVFSGGWEILQLMNS